MVCEEAGKYVYRYHFSLNNVAAVANCDMDGGYREIREGLTARHTLFQRA